MKMTRAPKKAKLEAAAVALIEELLDWDEQNEKSVFQVWGKGIKRATG